MKAIYKIYFGYKHEYVEMSEETNDNQEILDKCIDQLENKYASDNDVLFVSWENTVPCGGDVYEDEYVTGGNHGLNLLTNGIFAIERVYEILNLNTTKYEIHHEDWFDGIEISDKISSFEMEILPTKKEVLYVNYKNGKVIRYENVYGSWGFPVVLK